MFTSAFHPDEFIIDDDIPDDHPTMIHPFSTGYEARPPGQAYRAGANVIPFPDSLLIPPSDWQGIIEEQEATNTRLSDLILAAGLPSKNQMQTNYCWGNATVGTVEALHVVQNQPMIKLSAASVCAPMVNYRNIGYDGELGLEYIVQHGIVPEAQWPLNYYQSAKYHTPANIQLALDYRIVGWYELQPRNINQYISCLLRRIPVSKGLNWWGHQIYGCDAVWFNGAIGSRDRNSWGDAYGSKGFLILQGAKMPGDQQVAPFSTVAA